jgi:hypothetical protein
VAVVLGLAACVSRSTEPVTERESAARGEQDDPTSSDPLAELLDLQPQLSPAGLPAEFHSPPAPPPPIAELHEAEAGSSAASFPSFLDNFTETRAFSWLPDREGACEVRHERVDGKLEYVNRTNWHDGLPVASFVDTNGDSRVDEYLHYTHDAHRRLIRVVEDHPEFSPTCIWRKDTVEIGYDAHGGLVRVTVESARDMPVSWESQTRTYDKDGRIQSVFRFGSGGRVMTAYFMRWVDGRVERIDTFTHAGWWVETRLVTVRGAFTRVDWFRSTEPDRGEEPTWRSANIYEETDTEPRLRVILTSSPAGPVLTHETKIENDLQIGLNYSWKEGQLSSRTVTAPDESWFREEPRADDSWERVIEAGWDEPRETFVYTYKGSGRTIYEFNCPTFTPPKITRRERCTPLPKPIFGPHDSDI